MRPPSANAEWSAEAAEQRLAEGRQVARLAGRDEVAVLDDLLVNPVRVRIDGQDVTVRPRRTSASASSQPA